MAQLTERAPAKLNLYLHVTGRRGGGYHELDSLFAFLDLADELRFGDADGIDVRYPGVSGSWATNGDDLVSRAAHRLADMFGGGLGAAIEVEKSIPVAAGLGGGSADAAAALRGLQRLWQVPFTGERRAAFALGLGADVPACLESAPVQVAGIGERLTPAPALPEVALLLVNPGVPVPTGRVFAALDGDFSAPAPLAEPPADADALAAALLARRNDLEAPARALAPEIGDALGWLAAREGCLLARMSGSGATCFGLFAEPALARAAAADAPAGWWIRPARFASQPADASR